MTISDFGSRARLADLGRAGLLVALLLGTADGAPESEPRSEPRNTERSAPPQSGSTESVDPSPPPRAAEKAERRKSFTPSEKLPADASVSFPVDI